MQLFVRLPDTGCAASPENLARAATAAEELGYDGVSVQDHFFVESQTPCPDGRDPRTIFDAFQTLTYVAALTRRVRLLTAVLVAPLYHPARLGKQAASLDTLSGGRLVLGLGVGARAGGQFDPGVGQHMAHFARIAAREYAVFGVSGNRGQATDEAIQLLRALWTQDRASFAGQRFRLEDADVYPKPVQRPGPPIWVGGRSPAAQTRAALLGDGWMPSQASTSVFAAGWQRIREVCQQHGRPEPPARGPNLFAAVAPTDAQAIAVASAHLGERFESREALLGATLVGSPETVARRVEAYHAAGANVVDMKFLGADFQATLASIHLVAREVLPAFAG